MQLTANQRKTLRALYTRRGRAKHMLCVCEGLKSCRELLSARPELIAFAIKSQTTPIPHDMQTLDFASLTENEFNKISSTVTSQGIIMVATIPQQDTSPPITPFIPVLDKVSDPGNMGTIIRTLKATGLKHLWLTKGSTDPFGEKAIRSAMAAQFKINIRYFDTLDCVLCELRKFKFHNIFRTDCRSGNSLFNTDKLFDKSAIVFGAEASGAGQIDSAETVHIPMPGQSESINVAQAFTVCMFEAIRRGILN
ncbi:MAG: RNA methyltransferase [Victivallales bacterium]|nr:RNA methyltransferase [Victivallales bacterium]